MTECATAVAVLRMYQMYSGGYLVSHPPLAGPAACSDQVAQDFFSVQGQVPVLSKLFQCPIIPQVKSENYQKAKKLLFANFAVLLLFICLYKPASLLNFLYDFVTWRVSNPLIYFILFTFFKTEEQWRGKKA